MANFFDMPSVFDSDELTKSLRVSANLINTKEICRNYSHADWQYEKLMEQIKEFEANLDDSLDVMVQLASFGQSVYMFVEEIGFQNPSLIYFWGTTVKGEKAQLIQNVNQLNFLLLAVKKAEPSRPPIRIGFDTSMESVSASDSDT